MINIICINIENTKFGILKLIPVIRNFRRLGEFKEELQGEGHKVVVTQSPYSVVLITPLMQRVIQKAGNDPVAAFIDSTASCDQTNSSVTTFLIPSKAGALPICICLHSNQTEVNYTKVFELAKEQLLNVSQNRLNAKSHGDAH